MNTVEIANLRIDRTQWPRSTVNDERVVLFASIYQEGGELPPIEVVARGDGTLLVADGVHRSYAAAQIHRKEIDIILRTPEPGESTGAFIFRRGLETATTSALPLTNLERRLAARRLLQEHPELSHREISLGVSHNSVDRWAQEMAEPSSEDGTGQASSNPTTAKEVARKLVSILVRLDDAKGFLDTIAPSRMGKHLAEAYETRLGGDALIWARRFAQWTTAAAQVLEGQS